MSATGGSVLVVDVGTSGVRAAIVRPDATVEHEHHVRAPARHAGARPGRVRRRAAWPTPSLAVAQAALADGRAGRRRRHRQPARLEHRVGARHRTAGGPGHRLAGPAHRRHLPRPAGRGHPPGPQRVGHQGDGHPRRGRPRTQPGPSAGELCFGTVDTWVAWTLSGGAAGSDALHVTDATNAAVTALVDPATIDWDEPLLERLRIPLADAAAVVDSSGAVGRRHRAAGRAAHLRHRRRPAGLAGRPGLHAARAGQGHLRDRAGCSTSAPDRATARPPPGAASGGTFPIVAFRVARHGRPGAPRRSCSRPARASSGCATTSGSSPAPTSPSGARRSARRGGRLVRPRPARPRHPGVGLRRRGARSSA